MTQATIYLKYEKEDIGDYKQELSASILGPEQVKSIKNLLVDIVSDKVNMSASAPDFLLTNEFFRGQITILAYLITRSAASYETLNTLDPQAGDY